MHNRRFVSTLVTVAVLGGAAVAGYRTRDKWLPDVFPSTAAKAEGDHGHAEGADEHAGHDHAHGAGGA